VFKLVGIEVQLKWPPNTSFIPASHVLESGQRYINMRIQLKPDHGLILTSDGRAVAVLNNESFQALSICKAAQGYRIEVWVADAEWAKRVEEARKAEANGRKVVRMKVDILLFGRRDAGDPVAAALGRHQHFLQPPVEGMTDYPHENPQSLPTPEPLPGTREIDNVLPSAMIVDGLDELEDHADRPQDGNATQLANLIADIDAFFDQLPAHRSISMASKDPRSLSPLFQ